MKRTLAVSGGGMGWVALWCLMTVAGLPARASSVRVWHADWQQVSASPVYTLAMERRGYTHLDVGGRFVLAVEAGRNQSPRDVIARWAVTHQGQTVWSDQTPLATGMAVVDFDLAELSPGRYDVSAVFLRGDQPLHEAEAHFDLVPGAPPAGAGRVPVVFPRGVSGGCGEVPISMGVPFPKGELSDANQVRLVTADGRAVPAQMSVRSRWGYHPGSSIRWLGVHFQTDDQPAWWPNRQAIPLFLEYGPDVRPAAVDRPIEVVETEAGYRVDTGSMAFTVRRQGFNLLDQVVVAGRPVDMQGAGFGAYIVDHAGDVYRAANDQSVALTIERQDPMRVVIRAEGWYVKDGTDGSQHSYTLPTDRISRFITRIEAYQGQPTVRIMHTWVMTFDSFTVRLADVGLSLPIAGARQAVFGTLDGEPIAAPVSNDGARLVQHRHHRLVVGNGRGEPIATGEKTDGNFFAVSPDSHVLGVSLREAWQRFPKEFEVLPDQVRLHIWPAHGRVDPAINPYAPDRISQLWFAHQGRLLDLRFPWDILWTVLRMADDPSTDIYHPGGTAMGGVHASAMGASITSDIQLTFAGPNQIEQAQAQTAAFQHRAHAMAHPRWVAKSMALGPIHPHDPEQFPEFEKQIDQAIKGYVRMQDDSELFGMFLYRPWHHSRYLGNGQWAPYRYSGAGHHYELYMPWLLYARSGDPQLLDHGLATSRQVSDLAVIHYDDPDYPHQEFYSRQKRIVGSVRHTNGYVLWGGDHALLGHLTTFNGFLLGYYLTGDLRLREIVADQWGRTLMEDRANPLLSRAVRLGPGRDNNNAMGELIDLYQLTYDPRVLVWLEPMTHRYLKTMRGWGLPLQNILGFSNDPCVSEALLTATQQKLRQPRAEAYPALTGHSLGVMAMASLLAPGQGFAIESVLDAARSRLGYFAEALEDGRADTVSMYRVPDVLIYMPRVMAAVAHERKLGTFDQTIVQQVLPIGNKRTDRAYTRIIARQERDEPFVIEISGTIQEPGIPLQVFAPDGSLVLNTTVLPGEGKRHTIEADGQVGEYVIFVRPRDGKDVLKAPVTDLPGEVYVAGHWSQPAYGRYYTLGWLEGDQPLTLRPSKAAGQILTWDFSRALAETSSGDQMVVNMPAGQGVWLNLQARYVSTNPTHQPIVLAVDRERAFVPSESSLATMPRR